MSTLVQIEKKDATAVCTLSRPDKRNPLSLLMRDALRQALEELRTDAAVRSVIITGAGKAFCSGLDLQALADPSTLSSSEHLADSQSIHQFFETIAHYPKPTIAAVNGPAIAGGCGLALLCDVTLASDSAYFCFSEVKIGFVPALVGVYLQQMVGVKAAREMLLTARRIPAAEALRLRLVSEVVTDAALLSRALEVAHEINAHSPAALQATKVLLLQTQSLSFERGLEQAVEVNAQARSSPECIEGVRAFLEKRKPRWPG